MKNTEHTPEEKLVRSYKSGKYQVNVTHVVLPDEEQQERSEELFRLLLRLVANHKHFTQN